MNATAQEECRVYVACLASYNAGILFGEWLDCAGLDADEIGEAISAIIAKSPSPDAEEWAFHDFEGWGGLQISESESVENLADWAAILDEVDGPQRLAFVEHGCSLDDFDDAYRGEWGSEQEYAENLIEECDLLNGTPEHMLHYFDFEAFTRDLFMTDCLSIEVPAGGVWVFDNV